MLFLGSLEDPVAQVAEVEVGVIASVFEGLKQEKLEKSTIAQFNVIPKFN
jgi:hypothetical protein